MDADDFKDSEDPLMAYAEMTRKRAVEAFRKGVFDLPAKAVVRNGLPGQEFTLLCGKCSNQIKFMGDKTVCQNCGEVTKLKMSDLPAEAVVCEDVEARIVQHNIDYEQDQNARCALEMATALRAGRASTTGSDVIETADQFFDWIQRKTGRIVLKEEQ